MSPGVDVATMLPQAVDTPIFARAGSFSGRAARPIPPVLDSETVASGILRCAESPKREVTYSRMGRALELMHSVAPALCSRFLPPAFEAGNYARRPIPPTPGSIIEPADGAHSIDGGWRQGRKRELIRALGSALRGLIRG